MVLSNTEQIKYKYNNVGIVWCGVISVGVQTSLVSKCVRRFVFVFRVPNFGVKIEIIGNWEKLRNRPRFPPAKTEHVEKIGPNP